MTLTLDPKSLPALKLSETDTVMPAYTTNVRFSCEIYNASGVISYFESTYEVKLGIYPGAPVKANTCFDPLNPLACVAAATTTNRRRLYGPLEAGIREGLAVNSRYASFLLPSRRTQSQRNSIFVRQLAVVQSNASNVSNISTDWVPPVEAKID